MIYSQEVDFERVLKELIRTFELERVRYAMIGGFALGALGAPRATMDLDFLIHQEDLKKAHQALLRLGYQRRFHTQNVSQYASNDSSWGSVDFIHAFRKISLGMLDRSLKKPIFAGTYSVPILQPEDVIGLKVQAMANDVARRNKEMADIEALMSLYRNRLDWARLKEYYSLFGLEKEFKEHQERFGHAE